MRKLLSVGALLAASTLSLWNPQPAVANARVGVDVVVVRHHRHHHYYRYHHYRHGYYYRYYR
jgi:hypothetical protein